jgi:hypothetical protein
VIAVLAFAGLPTILLLAAYFPRLVELEDIAQQLKRQQHASRTTT